MICRHLMKSLLPTRVDATGLEEAANPDLPPVLSTQRTAPLKIAGFALIFLVLSLLAFAVFLGIAIGVTILVALLLPNAGFVDLIAAVAGVVVASLCFGVAS